MGETFRSRFEEKRVRTQRGEDVLPRPGAGETEEVFLRGGPAGGRVVRLRAGSACFHAPAVNPEAAAWTENPAFRRGPAGDWEATVPTLVTAAYRRTGHTDPEGRPVFDLVT